jgi:hypothetical protein
LHHITIMYTLASYLYTMKDVLPIRLEKETINKLDSLAKKNGFTLSKQARLIIENHFNHNWYKRIFNRHGLDAWTGEKI